MPKLQSTAEKCFAKMKFNALSQIFVASLGVLLMIVQNEVAWRHNAIVPTFPVCGGYEECDDEEIRRRGLMYPIRRGLIVVNAIRGMITASTVVLFSLFESPLGWPFILEAIVNAIHIFPGFEDIVGNDQPTTYLTFNTLMLGRQLTSVDFTASFIIKSALKTHPVGAVISLLFILLVLAGYTLHLTESILCGYYPDMQCVPMGFWDAQWLLVITILTIGYGDLSPHSDGARFIAILGGLVGTLITAVSIALTADYLHLTRPESKVTQFMVRHQNRRIVSVQSGRVLRFAFAAHAHRRVEKAKAQGIELPPEKYPKHLLALAMNSMDAEIKLHDQLRQYRDAKRFVRSNDGSHPTDKQLTLLERLQIEVDEIKSQVDRLNGLLSESNENDQESLNDGRPPWVTPLKKMVQKLTDQAVIIDAQVLDVEKRMHGHLNQCLRKQIAIKGSRSVRSHTSGGSVSSSLDEQDGLGFAS